MLDRVREGIFSTLQPWLEGAHVLDLFAGSGALSLEALSRGATMARLVERRPDAAVVAGRNALALELAPQVQLLCGDALDPAAWASCAPNDLLVDLADGSNSALDAGSFDQAVPAGWDVVFFDPPYPLLDEARERMTLLATVDALVGETLAHEGVLVFHAPERALELGELTAAGRSVARRTYGSNAIWYLQRDEHETRPDERPQEARG